MRSAPVIVSAEMAGSAAAVGPMAAKAAQVHLEDRRIVGRQRRGGVGVDAGGAVTGIAREA